MKNCKQCGQKTGRSCNARYCHACAASKECALCHHPHGLGTKAKYCKECLPKVPVQIYHPKQYRRIVSPRMAWDADTYLGMSPSEMDWARLAAYIDGEGSINLSPRKTPQMKSPTFCGRIQVTNTDFRLIKWCFDVFGMTFTDRKHSPGKREQRQSNWKPCFWAVANGFRAAWIARNCAPWFLLKGAQAQILIDHQRSTAVGVFERGDSITTPQNILDYRLKLKTKLHELNKRGPREDSRILAKEA